MDKVFRQLETTFVDRFEKEIERINRDFNYVISSLYVYPPNDHQKSRSCHVGLDVVFKNVEGDNSDNLSLELYIVENVLFEVNGKISWGYPTGERVYRMFENPVEFNDETVKLIWKKLPIALEELRKAIIDNPRGK